MSGVRNWEFVVKLGPEAFPKLVLPILNLLKWTIRNEDISGLDALRCG